MAGDKKTAKKNTKTLRDKKIRRRKLITFTRMCRYGVNNFTRNAWLTLAATAVMVVTLTLIFLTVASQMVLTDSVKLINEKVSMSIYLKNDVDSEQVEPILAEITALDNVKNAWFISSEDARKSLIEDNKEDKDVVEAIAESNDQLPGTIRVNVLDINDVSSLREYVESSELLKELLHETKEASFDGDRRNAIQTIGSWMSSAQNGGYILSSVAIVISSLIIFNTIRMAIFSRKEEIEMMKLIGADKSFIRGPFIVEAMMYGFMAAIVSSGIGYGLLVFANQKALEGVDVQTTMNLFVYYYGVVLLSMILLGALIGMISSVLATRRYLKV